MLASFAIFGSHARGDFDRWSDRDLLVVADNSEILPAACANLSKLGWSCSAYTTAKLRWMASTGSLFIEHLRRESRIVLDPKNRIPEILKSYCPKNSYDAEFSSGRKLLHLLFSTPKTNTGLRWAFDILAVAYRTMAVPYLAERNLVAFSKEGIERGIRITTSASVDDVNLLSELRQYKAVYRRNSRAALPNWHKLDQACRIIERIFKADIPLRVVPTDVAIHESIESIESEVLGYHKLRTLERGLIAIDRRYFPNPELLRKLMANVAFPQAYALEASRPSSPFIQAGLKCLKAA